jgi:hypothetical protein
MSIVVYKCDVCDREIEILQNPKGLETVGRCVITDGCRGNLFETDTKQDFIRGKFPEAVTGLTDWTQRKILYNHTQSVATFQWRVEHDLGVNPSIQVFGERPTSENEVELIEIEPDSIIIEDENTLILNFSRTESGTAQCIARSSRPIVEGTRVDEVVVADVAPFQLTSSSRLSIATLDDSTIIDITLSFTTPDGSVTDLTYSVDDVPSILSPWVNFDKIFFHGNVYTVRSFDVISKIELTDGTIVDSSSVYIKNVATPSGGVVRAMNAEEIIILLSDDPYTIYDKQVKQFIDPTPIGIEQAAFSFYYDSNEIFGYDNLIETVFPHIREV